MTSLLKESNIVYVDKYLNTDLLDNEIKNIKNCPTSDLKHFIEPDQRTFNYDNINHLIHNVDYRSNTNNDSKMEFYNIPNCNSDKDFSGCCKMLAQKSPNPSISGEYIDQCKLNTSTGFMYEYNSQKYNICHSNEIQKLTNMFDEISNKKNGLEKFFILLLVSIIVILFYTLVSLPYEFWLRYGNSKQCIYYKVKSTCNNMGSKKSDSNGKLTIIEYIFPDNLNNFPYEPCKTTGQSGGMKGGKEKDGAINSNYIEYLENGSKCINVDFGDDIDDRTSRQFPYNLGEYANDPSKVKNRFIAMILKGFSFYFLYTVLLIRKCLNFILSSLSKQYQKIFEKSEYISSVLLILNFILTPFIIIGVIISVIFGILSIFPMYITIADFFKSINIFKEDIESSPSSTKINSNYYKIYDLNNIFYSLNPKNFDPDSDGFHKNNKFFAIIIGVMVALAISGFIYLGNNEDGTVSSKEGQGATIATIILLIVCPIGFYAASKYISMPEGAVKLFDVLKKIILNIALIIPVFFTIITTFALGMTGSILAGLYMAFSTLFKFYYIPYSNSIEFLDLLKSHSKLLTILLLLTIITSAGFGLNSQVTGILGGLFGLYLLYELYIFFNK